MEYLIGTVLGLMIAGLAKLLNFDKDRSFYPVILIVIAMYYVLFAFMSENADVIIKELIVALLFSAVAIIGARLSVLFVAIGLITHGVFDIFHSRFVLNVEVPLWWPGFCASIDIVLGIVVLYLMKMRSHNSLQPTAESGG